MIAMTGTVSNTRTVHPHFLSVADFWGLVSWATTLLRLPIVVVGLAFMAGQNRVDTVAVVVCLVILDIADGDIHRLSALDHVQEFRNARRIADAVLDRITLHSFFLVAISVYGGVAALAYGAVLIREVPLTYVVVRSATHDGKILKANVPSKIASVLVAAIGINIITPFAPMIVLEALMFVLGAVGLAGYIVDGVAV